MVEFARLRGWSYDPTLEVQVTTVDGLVVDQGLRAIFKGGEGLRMTFSVQRTMTPTPDNASVSIYNLDPDRAERFGADFASQGYGSVTIRAGYGLRLAGLFTGDLRTLRTSSQEGPDLVTSLTADDGGDALAEVIFPIATGTLGLTSSQMVDGALAAMNAKLRPGEKPWTKHASVGLVLAQSDTRATTPYSYVPVGKVTDLLDAAARRCNCRWWARDKQIFFGFRGQADASRPAVVVDERNLTGSVGTEGSGLMTFPLLLDTNILPGGQVAYKRQLLRVEAVNYQGDTRGLFTCQVTGRVL